MPKNSTAETSIASISLNLSNFTHKDAAVDAVSAISISQYFTDLSIVPATSLSEKYCHISTTVSATSVPIAAPAAPYSGIYN